MAQLKDIQEGDMLVITERYLDEQAKMIFPSNISQFPKNTLVKVALIHKGYLDLEHSSGERAIIHQKDLPLFDWLDPEQL